jgi:hypothetical protein
LLNKLLNKLDRGWLSRVCAAVSVLVVLLGGFPRPGSAQGALVAVEPAEMAVDPGTTFTATVTVDDAVDLVGYEFEMSYDPAVVAVVDVEPGGFLEEAVPLGPSIDNEAGSLSFGVVTIGEGPGAEGGGDLAVLTLEALEDGTTVLNLRNVRLLDSESDTMAVSVEDGRLRVGSGAWPTDVPTSTPFPTPTSGPTAVRTREPTEEATPVPTATESATRTPEATPGLTATATGTPAEGETPAPTATSSRTPTETAEPTFTATSTEAPTEASPTPSPSPSSTATQVVAAGETEAPAETATLADTPQGGVTEGATAQATAAAEPERAETEEPAGGEAGSGEADVPARGRGWLIGAAVVLGLLGLALIGGGIYVFGPPAQEPAASEHKEE